MVDFINQKVDVLVCTSIIEMGIDIPNANTIIINKAHRFGLSQLYQIRGRVGRGHNQAYAYLLVPKGHHLSKNVYRRLKTLKHPWVRDTIYLSLIWKLEVLAPCLVTNKVVV